MAQILSGIPVREKIKLELISQINKLEKKPTLAIIQVGDREDSNIYIKHKIKFGGEIGVEINHSMIKGLNEGKIEEDLIQQIQKLNADESVDGIIVQLPLPENINVVKILRMVKVEKDPEPATASAVIDILDFYNIDIQNKKVCVVGQGLLAGKAIADELEQNYEARITRCDVNTRDIQEIARYSEILISAVGKAGLITKDFVNENQIVIDVGFDRNVNGKLVGDVLFEDVEPIVKALTPVPGGVGPVTVACLFKNLVLLASR
jgi:methylenetetrahydrofolate dehydrogenase (NADP+) / methenyltetrahydrofolate cyclohydrolase